MGVTPNIETARGLALTWGVYPAVIKPDGEDVNFRMMLFKVNRNQLHNIIYHFDSWLFFGIMIIGVVQAFFLPAEKKQPKEGCAEQQLCRAALCVDTTVYPSECDTVLPEFWFSIASYYY